MGPILLMWHTRYGSNVILLSAWTLGADNTLTIVIRINVIMRFCHSKFHDAKQYTHHNRYLEESIHLDLSTPKSKFLNFFNLTWLALKTFWGVPTAYTNLITTREVHICFLVCKIRRPIKSRGLLFSRIWLVDRSGETACRCWHWSGCYWVLVCLANELTPRDWAQ